MDDPFVLLREEMERIGKEVEESKRHGQRYVRAGSACLLTGLIGVFFYDWRLALPMCLIIIGLGLHDAAYSRLMSAYVTAQNAAVVNGQHAQMQNLLGHLPHIIQQHAPAAVATAFSRRAGGPLS